MKKTKKAIVLIYVLFMVTISVLFATILLNNNSYLFNITDLFEVDTKLLSNIDSDAQMTIDISKDKNSNGSGFIDNLSCPGPASIIMSGSVNTDTIGSVLVNSGSIYCEGTYFGDSVKLYFNTGVTDFTEAEYKGNLVTLSGGLGLTNFTDSDNTIIDFSLEYLTTSSYYAGTTTDLGGSYIWSNLSNAQGNNTSTYAQTTLTANPSLSNTLSLNNFNFSSALLPSDAIIKGIEVKVEWVGSTSAVTDYTVQLTKDGINGVGNNLGLNTSQTSKAFRTYGGISEKWGTTWTKAEIESPNFGVLLQYNKTGTSSRTSRVYRVNITINYAIVYNYFVPDGIDDNFNSDNYLVTSTGTTATGTYYPNSSQDDDNFARKTLYGFISQDFGFKKVLWNTNKTLKMIDENINNNDNLNVKIGNVTSGYLYLDLDKDFEIKLIKFDRTKYNETNELVSLESLTGSSTASIGYLQKIAGTLKLSDTITGYEYNFDFQNNDYAIFIKDVGTGTLLYSIKGETSTGTGIYINPIDDSDSNIIRYLGNEILIDSNGRYISKETELFFKK